MYNEVLKAKNNARTTLKQSVTPLSIKLYVGDVSVFPEPPFLVTVDKEIMKVVSVDKTNNVLYVLRAQEGTNAVSHIKGALVENRFTAGTLESLYNRTENLAKQTLGSLRKTLFVYCYPSAINNLWSATAVGNVLAEYDDVTFPQDIVQHVVDAGNYHYDWDKVPVMISVAKSKNPGFMAYGYITVLDFVQYSEEIVEKKIQAWKSLGVDGIFWDEYGFDYFALHNINHYNARLIQNKALELTHKYGLVGIVNAWNIDDVFDTEGGAIPELDQWLAGEDGYLYESIPYHAQSDQTTQWASAGDIWYKAYRINNAYAKYKVKMYGIGTLGTDVINSPEQLEKMYNLGLGIAYSIGLYSFGIQKRNYNASDPVLLPTFKDKIKAYNHLHNNVYSYYAGQTWTTKAGNVYTNAIKYVQPWTKGSTVAVYTSDGRTPLYFNFANLLEWDVDTGFVDHTVPEVLNNVKLDSQGNVVIRAGYQDRFSVMTDGSFRLGNGWKLSTDANGLLLTNENTGVQYRISMTQI